MRASWAVFEGRLAEVGGWVLRRGFSVVDVHFYAWIRAGVEMDGMVLGKFPAIKGWFERVDRMEEVKRAYERVKDGVRM
jgi:glutathione S-transferase